MKKKVLVLALALIAATVFGGCARTGAVKISEEVANADPWVEYGSYEEVQSEAGFEITYPETFAGHTAEDIVYYYCAPLKEIQISYDKELADYIRKAKDDGEISGDYQEYAFETDTEVNGNTVTLKGTSEDSICLAIWRVDDFAYCVRAQAGITKEDMTAAVSAVQ